MISRREAIYSKNFHLGVLVSAPEMSFSPHHSIVVEDETNLEPVRFTLKWTIHDFEGLKNKTGYIFSNGITMAELGMGEDIHGRWRTAIRPCHSITENNLKMDYVGFYLWLTDEDLKSTSYTGKLAFSCVLKQRVTTGKLMDVPVYTAIAFTTPNTFSSVGAGWGTEKTVSHQDLSGSGAKALKDSCLNFSMDVIVYEEPKTIRTSEAVCPSLPQHHHQFLARQLKQQWTGGDFLLVSDNGKEYHVDRCLLMAHSPIFTAMLNHDSKEKLTSRCEMDDVDGECVEILMEYVYGCEFGKIQANNAEKVLVMADKYQMLDLRAVCERTLANNITVDNAVQVFVLARQRNLGTLKDVAKKFIRKNMDLEAILDG